jgi:hypothetical protein
MKFREFEFLICSPFDKEKLTCEIYYKDELIADISQEEDMKLSIYPPEKNQSWHLPLTDFQEAIIQAKMHLLGITSY